MAGKVLVTGAAGFIGAFLVKRLPEATDDVIVGLDNVNSHYDPGIKEARLAMLREADAGEGRGPSPALFSSRAAPPPPRASSTTSTSRRRRRWPTRAVPPNSRFLSRL